MEFNNSGGPPPPFNFGGGGNIPPPPPPTQEDNQQEEQRISFEESVNQQTQQAQQPSVEDVFSGYSGQGSQNQSQSQGYQEPQQQQQGNQENGIYEEEWEGKPKLSKNSLSLVGLVVAVVILISAGRLGIGKYKSYRNDREYRIKQNTLGSVPFVDYTNEGNNDYEYEEYDESTSVYASDADNIITDIAKYRKGKSEDGRTQLILTLDKYGTYNIYVSQYQYDSLEEEEGYILVDMEILNKKVNYVFISNKQENFRNIIEGK